MCVPCHRRPLALNVLVPVASLLDAVMRGLLTPNAGTVLSVVAWGMATENRMNGRAVGIPSVAVKHLSMASGSGECDVVGTKAVPQTPQGPRGLTCVFYKRSTKYSSSAADTLKLYHHIPGSGCPFDIWQQTWVRHEHIQGRNATECNTLFTSYSNPIERKKERKPLFASFSSRGKARGRDLQTPDCLLLEPGYESSRQGSSDAGIGELNIAT